METYTHLYVNSCQNEKCFGQNYIDDQNTHYTFNNFLIINRAVYGIMLGNTVESDMLKVTI